MNIASRWFSSLLLGVALLSPLMTTGCTEHYYRAYDPDRHEYHRWDANEDMYYHQWEHDNHREDRNFRKLDKDDQNKYWQWRHDHGDHDHDTDHDNDRH